MRRTGLEEVGLALLSAPDALTRSGADTDLPMFNILLVGFVTSVAAGIFVATLNIKPRKS